LLPDDNFEGRSLSALGVGETGGIYVEPIGTTLPTDIFPLQSFSSSDNNVLIVIPNLTTGKATFTAGNEKGSTVVTAKDKDGNEETYTIEVVEPQGVRFEEYEPWRNGMPTRQPSIFGGTIVVCVSLPNQKRGAIMHNKMYCIPTDVSFKGVLFAEKECPATEYAGTLVLLGKDVNHPDVSHPAWKAPVEAGKGDVNLGCRIGSPSSADPNHLPGDIDTASFVRDNAPGDGVLIWDIPWTYQTTSMQKPKVFITAMRQEMRNIGDKKSTVSKNGITVERTIP